MNYQTDIFYQQNISNPIILNNYSIQNVIINPINVISYEKDPFNLKNIIQNPSNNTPKRTVLNKNLKYKFQQTTPFRRFTPITSKKYISIMGNDKNLYTSTKIKKRQKHAEVIPYIFNLSQNTNFNEKHPQDTIKKNNVKKNYLNKIEISMKRCLRNSLSTGSLHNSSKKEKDKSKDNDKNKTPEKKPNKIESFQKMTKEFKKVITSKLINYLTQSNDIPKNSKIKAIYNIHPTKLILKEYTYSKLIGKGTYGNIYEVKWVKNNKKYALKKELLIDKYDVDNRKKACKIIQSFISKTGSKGIINLYNNLCYKVKLKNNKNVNSNDNNIYYQYYELMEKAEKDWDNEISERRKLDLYYTEKELLNIMKQLITTLSLLQKNRITHRDIKPQNILILNGYYKLCDFGETRQLERDGLIVQRVRGSELYMSTILFNGLHQKLIQVKHNTYKSDVFSLGMCLFYAGSLSYGGVDSIRELNDMNEIKQIIFDYLGERYSSKLILIILSMLEINEEKRPNFIQLEEAFRVNFNII